VVIEHEVVRVFPVVGDVLARVVPHHIVGRHRFELGIGLLLLDEPVHLAAVDFPDLVDKAVRPTGVEVIPVVEGAHARLAGIGEARHRAGVTAEARDPVGARVGAESSYRTSGSPA